MRVRPAVEDDSARIEEIAQQSFQTSYSLSPQDIEAIVSAEFSADAVTECIHSDDDRLLVAEADDDIVGFVETRLTGDQDGEIRWLHVDPTARGQGIGTTLFEQAIAQLRERTADHVHAIVLAENEEGSQFFEQWGLERSDSEQRSIGEEDYQVQLFTATPEEFEEADGVGDSDEDHVPPDGTLEVDGETKYIDTEEGFPGDDGQFFVVYNDETTEERYGFYCSNCGTFTANIDGQGTIVCEECGNVHRPEEWDASYL